MFLKKVLAEPTTHFQNASSGGTLVGYKTEVKGEGGVSSNSDQTDQIWFSPKMFSETYLSVEVS